MKVAIYGVWHVHAGGYTRKAMEMGEVVGLYEKNDTFVESVQKVYGKTDECIPFQIIKGEFLFHILAQFR